MNHKKSVLTAVMALLFTVVTLTSITPAYATIDPDKLQTDLNNLVAQGRAISSTMNVTSLTASTMSTKMSTFQTDISNFSTNLGNLHAYLTTGDGSTGTFSLTPEHLLALQNLSSVISSITTANMRFTGQTSMLAPTTYFSTLQTAFSSMLRLSDDIGLMANRILEMSDKILSMADNIGLMADRILITQMIQSNNLALVVNAILQTQQNMILMMDVFDWRKSCFF